MCLEQKLKSYFGLSFPMSFTASQTVLHLAECSLRSYHLQCYDSTPKLLKNGAVQAGGLAERIAILYMKPYADASMWFRSLSADKVMSYFRKKQTVS